MAVEPTTRRGIPASGPESGTPTESGESGTSTIPRRSLQEEVASRLRNEIVEGVWPPGSRLQERILCERYGVSRSPLREAFQVMAKEGLLELLPGRGAVVTRPTMTDAVEYAEIITALETLAIRSACERASDEQLEEIRRLHEEIRACNEQRDIERYFRLNNALHRAIVAASGNAALIAVHEGVQRHITRLQNLSGALEAEPDKSFHEHERFVQALLARDADRAAAALHDHLTSTAEKIKERIIASE
ncbi:MAG TPA: GntR family transcriptional regulator [Woeseiaceae bacterium]|nr:GntR family transcriptional regulator [Woeseiaceae bacterium]